jgi:hypothetical protein
MSRRRSPRAIAAGAARAAGAWGPLAFADDDVRALAALDVDYHAAVERNDDAAMARILGGRPTLIEHPPQVHEGRVAGAGAHRSHRPRPAGGGRAHGALP